MDDDNIEYLVRRGKLSNKHSFTNLRSIKIYSCDELKYVFSLSVAQNLVQLQSLSVDYCLKVEEIISKERMEDDNASHIITLPALTVLKIIKAPKLLGFYTGNQRDSTYEIIKPNDESVNKTKETRNDIQVAGSTSSRSKVAQVGASCTALFPSNCISWLPNIEKLELGRLRSEQGSEVTSVETFDKQARINGLFDKRARAAASTEDNIHEEGKETGGGGTMTLFPKLLNGFTLFNLPNLERFLP
ncbi:unnamed protein product [Prunus armeniaca]